MEKKDVFRIFNTLGNNNREKGMRIYRTGLVKAVSYEVNKDEAEFCINGVVESENSYDKYKTEINIDLENNDIAYTECECIDFNKNDRYSIGSYVCKHIVATYKEFMEMVERDRIKLPTVEAEEVDYGNYILNYFNIIDKKQKQRARLEVTLKRPQSSVYHYNEAEFKIGIKKLYVMKNIKDFISAYRTGSTINYGKDFEYNVVKYDFSREDEELIRYIESQIDIDDSLQPYQNFRSSNGLVSGKTLKVTHKNLKYFLKYFKNKKINLQRPYSNSEEMDVIEGDMDLSFNISQDKYKNITLKNQGELPTPLSNLGDVFIHQGKIYIPSAEQSKNFTPLYNVLVENKEVKFKREITKDVITKVLPAINSISKENNIEKELQDRIINVPFKAEFYLDRVRKAVVLTFKAVYGEQKFNVLKGYEGDDYILRKEEEENKVFNKIEYLGFEVIDGDLIFTGSDEKYFYFLTEGIKELTKLGEIFYSDKFKQNTIYTSKSIRAEITKNKQDYLDFSFQIGEVDGKEIKNILNAFRENRRFFKLKDESFVDLADKEMKDFLTVLDNLGEDNKFSSNNIKLQNNKAMYLNSIIEDKDIRFIEGKAIVQGISDKIKKIDAVDFNIPDGLNATLREYQKVGYNWLKTLAYYGFGGILADEMGLGKTVQTIAFLLSEKDKKSLIVAPTSLIYNWNSEFEKFAPSMKVLVLHGNREEREKLMDTVDEYDVLLTTYNLLRNDFDFYSKKDFDYIVIDEAQNIKNPLSQNAEAIKGINGKVKFALTGTPIENSLIELWSIFDFIMPGYLFNRTKFTSKFTKKIDDNDTLQELNRMIKPFILRRYKKDVMIELPDKIEKRLIVEMTDEQKKVYKTYAQEIKRNLEEINKEEGLNNKSIEVFSYLTKLRQLCLDPTILIEGYKGGSGKLDALLETIEQGIEEGHKILVFSQFTTVLGNISDILNKGFINHFYLDGSTKAKERIRLVNEFNQGDTQVFLISLKAGGTGLNLTGANIVIHFDPWWNPAVEDQATDRAHRFGQKNVVEVIKLISKGTIEEKILKLQDDKKEIIKKVMSGEFKSGSILSDLSEKELIDLFS